jgi:hypothetical protein
MSKHLLRWAGFSAGYAAVVLADRVVTRLENERVRQINLGDEDLEPADVSEVLTSHGCPTCCVGAAFAA